MARAVLSTGGDGKSFSKSLNTLDAAELEKIYPRQSHADTEKSIDAILHKYGGTVAAPVVEKGEAKNGTMSARLTFLSLEAQMKALEDVFTPEERALLAKQNLVESDQAPEDAAEDVQQPFEDEEAALRNLLGDTDWLTTEIEVAEAEDLVLEGSVNSDSDDDDSGSATDDDDDDPNDKPFSLSNLTREDDDDDGGKRKKRRKGDATPAAKRSRNNKQLVAAALVDGGSQLNDEETFSAVVAVKKRVRTSGKPKKMSDEAAAVDANQKERKRKRTKDLTAEEGMALFRADLHNYSLIALADWQQRLQAPPERAFSQLVREYDGDDAFVHTLKESLVRIELDIASGIDQAATGAPTEFQFVRDFVSDAEELVELSPANVGAVKQCAVLRREFPPEFLVALETTRTVDAVTGKTKNTHQVFHKSVARLVRATWFLTNMLTLIEKRVISRIHTLLRTRITVKSYPVFNQLVALLAADDKGSSVVNVMVSKYRDALNTLDTSTTLLLTTGK